MDYRSLSGSRSKGRNARKSEEAYNVWQITTIRTAAENGEEYETYGIRTGETVINDISPNRHKIEEFIRQLNSLGASEIHAYELVEDFLGR